MFYLPNLLCNRVTEDVLPTLAYAFLLNSQSVVLFGDVLQKRRVYVLAKRHFLDAFNVSSVHGRPQEDQFFRLPLSGVVVVRLLLVRLRWCVPFVRVLFLCGCRSLVGLVLLGWFPLLVLPLAFAVWVRVRGLRLLLPLVWVFLLCFSFLLGFSLPLVGGCLS